jgi:hypothetical protein
MLGIADPALRRRLADYAAALERKVLDKVDIVTRNG